MDNSKSRRKRRSVRNSVSFNNKRFVESFLPSIHSGCEVLGYEANKENLDVSDFADALLAEEIFSKYDDGKRDETREQATWSKFLDAELQCRLTNGRLRNDTRILSDRVICRMQHWIERCLGEYSEEQVLQHAAFGPGATFLLRRSERALSYKYSGKPESTLGNARLAQSAIGESPLWKRESGMSGDPCSGVHTVAGNRVVTVPKNRKTHRTIAIEPRMNIYIQKGIGQMIRQRLRRKGIDLSDQTVNQKWAHYGSVNGTYATVDLSMASDTVARVLPHLLLPEPWVVALEQSRSPFGLLPSGNWIKYQKFSSMGNGYTFELETLIFSALCEAIIYVHGEKEHRFSVYGDDIIFPTQLVGHLLEYLSYLGFNPNAKKTHYEGDYRESCGKHYYRGCDVTPFYIRRPVTDLSQLFLLHNNVWRWADRMGRDVSSTLSGLKALAPAKWRKPRLPDGFGDGAFIGAVDELRLDSHPYGWESWQAEVLTTVAKRELEEPSGSLIASLALMEQQDSAFREVQVSSNRERRVTSKMAIPRFPPIASYDTEHVASKWLLETDRHPGRSYSNQLIWFRNPYWVD